VRRTLPLLICLTTVLFLLSQGVINAVQTEGASISVVVHDDKGGPVVDAKLSISATDFFSTVRTAAEGKYDFKSLRPARYRITAEATSFRKQSITITVNRPDEVLSAVITLSPSSLHVAVLDSSNQPLSGVTVTLSAQDDGPVAAVARTTTDEAGDAYFGRLSPGSFQLAAMLRGYDEYRSQVFISSGITTELAVQLSVAPVIPVNENALVRYNVPNLPSKNVQAVFQDSEGWMWFGTDKGIARFNGADFDSSSTNVSPFEQLAGEDIRSIAEDQAGTIWLATPRGIRRISKSGAVVETGLNVVDVRHVSSSGGIVWISTASGLVKYDGKDFTTIDQSRGLPSSDIRAVGQDRTGKLWVATARGLASIDGTVVASFEQWRPPNPPAPQSAPTRGSSQSPSAATRERPDVQQSQLSAEIRCLFVEDSGTIWIATNQGVFQFQNNRLNPVALGERSGTATADTLVRAIGQDRRGRMWFALESGGALLYDPEIGRFQRSNLVNRDRVAAVFTGREGTSWFATDNGVVHADFYSFVSFNASRGLPDNDVRAVVEVPENTADPERGRLWFLSPAGLSRMEQERFLPVDRFRAATSVRAAAFDRSGSAWFATEEGAVKLSGQTITQFNESRGLASNNVRWVTVLSDDSVVFATSKGANIYKLGTLRNIQALAGYDVRHVFEEGDGTLWFSTTRGVVRFDPATNQSDLIDTARGLGDNDTRCVTRFNDQLLVATRAGVQTYRSQRPNAFASKIFDGEPASALFVDRDGFLWIGTDNGQVKKFATIGGHTVSATYSGELHALAGNRINSISEDHNGQIWIATDKGVVRHMPIRVGPITTISMRSQNSSDAVGPGPHDLPYGQQRLTFNFTAASMSGQVRYLYRLNPEQANEAWSLMPLQTGAWREIGIFGIDAGSHTFEVIAINRDLYGAGVPSGGAVFGATSAMLVRVGLPFWRRWWFYALTLALIGLGLATVFATRRLRDREYILPKELRTFVPIEPNPYIVGNAIRNENMFFGREDDFRYVRTKLEGVNQGVVIVFCGERRVGKSSILYQVLNGRLGERFVPVFVDMQEMVITSDSEFFARISRLIAEAVRSALNGGESELVTGSATATRTERLGVVAGLSPVTGTVATPAKPLPFELRVPDFSGRNPYPIFLDFLDDILTGLGDRTLLILIDEYELMEAKVDEGKLSADLFTFLAGLMDNKERLALIFTGSRRLEERDKKYWRELLRRSLFRKVGFLSEKDTFRLITEPVTGRMVFGRGVIETIYRLTAGQPFYTQVMCQSVVDYLNEHRQNWVTSADLQRVIADIVDNPLPQMIYTWDGLSDDEKLVLSLLAETLVDGNPFATAHELRTSVRINDYPVNLSENTIRLTLEEMFRRELLEKDNFDGFRFKIDLLRLWIRRSHSIWQVVKEVRTL
jgi:ligand-binding sensor domain-containing protein